MPTIRILGLDPGTNSFAYSVLELTATKTNATAKILQRGFILSTVHDLKSAKFLRLQQLAFEACLRSLAKEFNIQRVFAERYQSRGMGGATIEHVNIMLGMLIAMKLGLTRIFPASQWKNDLRRKDFNLDEAYELNKGLITPHEIDASHISWYGANNMCRGLLTHIGILDQCKNSKQVNVVADVKGFGELDTLILKRAFAKTKRKRKKSRK